MQYRKKRRKKLLWKLQFFWNGRKIMKWCLRATIWLHVNDKKLIFWKWHKIFNMRVSPRTAEIALHLFGMNAMKLSIIQGMLFHSCKNAISKSWAVTGGFSLAATHRPNMSRTSSIGFRLGEHAGHSIRCSASASKKLSTRRTVWGLVLSCIKKRITNDCSIRYDMEAQNIAYIPLRRQCAIPDYIQVRRFAYADSNP